MELMIAVLIVYLTIIFLWVILNKRERILMLLNGVKFRNRKQHEPSKGNPELYAYDSKK